MNEERAATFAVSVGVKIRAKYKKALLGKSRRDAIRVFCLRYCMKGQREVRQCCMQSCPLWAFRMGPVSRGREVSAVIPPSLPMV